MTLPPQIVLVEFNELSAALMERFIADNQLPNFKRLRDLSEVFTTQAEEREPNLEPWIQWVNVHTGVPYSDHGIFNLSEGHKLPYKCVWDVVSASGAPVWICGSMNVRYDADVRGYILPDPWATDIEPHPRALQPYFRFIQQNVLEYTNDRVPLTKSDYLKFLQFMVGHGLSLGTLDYIIRQLISEKTSHGGRWRRAFILDKLQFDLFSAVYKRLHPCFSTFFLNSTAHMQHMYWRNMQPELFKVGPNSGEQDRYASAILLGYQEMDKLLGRLFSIVGDGAIIIFATALSQQPCLAYEEAGGKHVHRPKDFASLLTFAGITSAYQVAPVMAEQFWVHLQNSADAEDVEAKLAALRVGQQRAMATRREGNSVFAACAIKTAIEAAAVLRVEGSNRSMPFFEMFYTIEGVKSGMHHPDGMLWIRDPRRPHIVRQGKVGLTSIAPTILDILGVAKPEYMKGQSLRSGSEVAAGRFSARLLGESDTRDGLLHRGRS
jgi:hypothetical protein